MNAKEMIMKPSNIAKAFAITTEFQAIETEQGLVITRIGRRQFPVDDWRQ